MRFRSLECSKPFPSEAKPQGSRECIAGSYSLAQFGAIDSNASRSIIMECVGEDVLLAIFSFLEVDTLCIASQVCQQWNEISNSNILWKSHVGQLCKRRKISAHLGRADNWKTRYVQLITGRLYPRSAMKTEKNNVVNNFVHKIFNCWCSTILKLQ